MVGVHIQHWLLGLNQVRRSYGRLAAHDRVGDSKGATMVKAGLDEKLYPVAKLATIVDLLGAEGISRTDCYVALMYSGSLVVDRNACVTESDHRMLPCRKTDAEPALCIPGTSPH
jgi:hypothetical protein